jgi:hypothetical protein
MENGGYIPFILNGKYFKIVSRAGMNVTAQCLCCSEVRNIKGAINATSNFLKHFRVSNSVVKIWPNDNSKWWQRYINYVATLFK